jgi:RNA polymerase sigma-70 factor, ECF subfamily
MASGDEPEAGDQAEPEESEEGERQCMARYLVAQLAMLPPPYRDALVLTELHGMPQHEAADALGISLPAMKSRVRRGRLLLRRKAEDCCRVALDGRDRVMDCEPRAPGCACDAVGETPSVG